jgi:hypothetical protein
VAQYLSRSLFSDESVFIVPILVLLVVRFIERFENQFRFSIGVLVQIVELFVNGSGVMKALFRNSLQEQIQ